MIKIKKINNLNTEYKNLILENNDDVKPKYLNINHTIDKWNLNKIPFKEGTKDYINEIGKWLFYQCVVTNTDEYINYNVIGLRFHRGRIPRIGEEVPNSYQWIDNEITDEMLVGTSSLGIIKDGEFLRYDYEIYEEINMYIYGNGQVIFIAGEDASGGEDYDELIIHDAVRYA